MNLALEYVRSLQSANVVPDAERFTLHFTAFVDFRPVPCVIMAYHTSATAYLVEFNQCGGDSFLFMEVFRGFVQHVDGKGECSFDMPSIVEAPLPAPDSLDTDFEVREEDVGPMLELVASARPEESTQGLVELAMLVHEEPGCVELVTRLLLTNAVEADGSKCDKDAVSYMTVFVQRLLSGPTVWSFPAASIVQALATRSATAVQLAEVGMADALMRCIEAGKQEGLVQREVAKALRRICHEEPDFPTEEMKARISVAFKIPGLDAQARDTLDAVASGAD